LVGRGQKLRKDKATAEIELHGLVPALAERGPSENRQRPDRPWLIWLRCATRRPS
jgi:hypothetical protein